MRWGNVGKLAAIVAAAALIAFGRGCADEEAVVLPLDELPGEPVEGGRLPRQQRARPAASPPSPKRTGAASPRARKPGGRARPRRAVRKDPAVWDRPERPTTLRRPSALPPAVPLLSPAPRRPVPLRVPEAAREFSFDR